MTSKGEMIGAALAKAVKATTGITSAKLGASMYRTNIKDVPKVEGLKRDHRRRKDGALRSVLLMARQLSD